MELRNLIWPSATEFLSIGENNNKNSQWNFQKLQTLKNNRSLYLMKGSEDHCQYQLQVDSKLHFFYRIPLYLFCHGSEVTITQLKETGCISTNFLWASSLCARDAQLSPYALVYGYVALNNPTFNLPCIKTSFFTRNGPTPITCFVPLSHWLVLSGLAQDQARPAVFAAREGWLWKRRKGPIVFWDGTLFLPYVTLVEDKI